MRGLVVWIHVRLKVIGGLRWEAVGRSNFIYLGLEGAFTVLHGVVFDWDLLLRVNVRWTSTPCEVFKASNHLHCFCLETYVVEDAPVRNAPFMVLAHDSLLGASSVLLAVNILLLNSASTSIIGNVIGEVLILNWVYWTNSFSSGHYCATA